MVGSAIARAPPTAHSRILPDQEPDRAEMRAEPRRRRSAAPDRRPQPGQQTRPPDPDLPLRLRQGRGEVPQAAARGPARRPQNRVVLRSHARQHDQSGHRVQDASLRPRAQGSPTFSSSRRGTPPCIQWRSGKTSRSASAVRRISPKRTSRALHTHATPAQRHQALELRSWWRNRVRNAAQQIRSPAAHCLNCALAGFLNYYYCFQYLAVLIAACTSETF